MRVFLAIFLAAVLVFIGTQIWRLYTQAGDYTADTSELQAEANILTTENEQYQKDIRYYQTEENLGKEALKYNRKKPGEELYILVPPQTEEWLLLFIVIKLFAQMERNSCLIHFR